MNKVSLKILEYMGLGIAFIICYAFAIFVTTIATVGFNQFLKVIHVSPVTEISFFGSKTQVPQIRDGIIYYITPPAKTSEK